MTLAAKEDVDRIVLERLSGLLREASDKYNAMLVLTARGGAKTVLCLMMAYQHEIKIWEVTKCMPERYNDNRSIDQDEVLESVTGYATRVASMVNTRGSTTRSTLFSVTRMATRLTTLMEARR